MTKAYYNEIDSYAAAWLRNLIAAGLIPAGDVDERSIAIIQPDDIKGYTQAHFFAGIGGWAYAARLAGWPDERPFWTGSCPCQPFSVAGKGRGADDERHLWPDFFRLIRACRPAVVMGEQVTGQAGYGWLDGVRTDLAGENYASRGVDIPACAVDAPHIRNRIYWVAVANAGCSERGPFPQGRSDVCNGADSGRQKATSRSKLDSAADALGNADSTGLPLSEREAVLGTGRMHEGRATCQSGSALGEPNGSGRESGRITTPSVGHGHSTLSAGGYGSFWSDHIWLIGADGKRRRAQSGICLLAHGVPARVGRLRSYGNAIVPQVAAEVIAAFMECEP